MKHRNAVQPHPSTRRSPVTPALFRILLLTVLALLLPGLAWAQTADIGVTVHDMTANPIPASADLTITFQVANPLGPDTAEDVKLQVIFLGGELQEDSLPVGCSAVPNAVFCNLGDFEQGDASYYDITYIAPAVPGPYTVGATVAMVTDDADTTNNTRTASIQVLDPVPTDLAVSIAGDATATTGEPVTYTLRSSNLGPGRSGAATSVTTQVPGNATLVSAPDCSNVGGIVNCVLGVIEPGEFKEASMTLLMPANPGTVQLSASTSGAPVPDPVPGNNSGTFTTTVEPPEADLFIKLNGPTTAVTGSTHTYQVIYHNNGPDDATGIRISYEVPEGASVSGLQDDCIQTDQTVECLFGELPAFQTQSLELQQTMPSEAGTITSSVAIEDLGDSIDPITSDNADSVETAVTVDDSTDPGDTETANLALLKLGPASVVAGSDFGYGLFVSNSGPATAVRVTVVDTLPAGVTLLDSPESCSATGQTVTCSAGDLAAGESDSFQLTVRAPDDATTIENVATATSSTEDPDEDNNEATVSTTVSANTVEPVPSSLTVAPAPGSQIGMDVTAGQTGVKALHFTAQAAGDEGATIGAVSLQLVTQGSPPALTNVSLYPTLASGQADTSQLLAAGTFAADGTLTLTPAAGSSAATVASGSTSGFVVLVNVGGGAFVGSTVPLVALGFLMFLPLAGGRGMRRLFLPLLVAGGLMILVSCQTAAPNDPLPDPDPATIQVVLTGVTAWGSVSADASVVTGAQVQGAVLTVVEAP